MEDIGLKADAHSTRQAKTDPAVVFAESRKVVNKFAELLVSPSDPFVDSLGETTLCELNGQLLTVGGPEDPALDKYRRVDGRLFPNLKIPEIFEDDDTVETEQPSTPLTSGKRKGTSSTDGGESVGRRKKRARAQQGVSDGGFLHHVLKSLFSFLPFGSPSSLVSSLDVSPQARACAFSWHPYKQVFAVALPNNVVYIYSLNTEAWVLALKHDLQVDITSLEWRPSAGHCLAVGCKQGICLWNMTYRGPSNLLSHEWFDHSATNIRYLPHPNNSNVTSLAWHPNGSILASASVWDNRLFLWDINDLTSEPVVLSPLSPFSSSLTLLRWSPSGTFLFVGTSSRYFLVFETRTWTYLCFKGLKSPIKAACWGPSDLLITASHNDDTFYTTQVSLVRTDVIQGVCLRADNIGEYEVHSPSGVSLRVGGSIRAMAWDVRGERLVVAFTEQEEGATATKEVAATSGEEVQDVGEALADKNVLAVYATSITKSSFDYAPRGFIRGPPGSGPADFISFTPQFPRGALLSTIWRNGKVSFYPLYYRNMAPPGGL